MRTDGQGRIVGQGDNETIEGRRSAMLVAVSRLVAVVDHLDRPLSVEASAERLQAVTIHSQNAGAERRRRGGWQV